MPEFDPNYEYDESKFDDVLRRNEAQQEKNSMFYWYPIAEQLKLRMPETILIPFTEEELKQSRASEILADETQNRIHDVIDDSDLDYPIFIRSDLASGKHEFENSCFVADGSDLESHVDNVLIFNKEADLLGLPYRGIVVREFLKLDWKFKCFANMPVAPEIRVFVDEEKIHCWHQYWPEDSIWFGHRVGEAVNWKDLLVEIEEIVRDRASEAFPAAQKFASKLEGIWSVDFAMSNKQWYFIDAALGKMSYHAPH